MNSTVTNTIKALVEHKKYDAITEYANVLHGKNNLIVSEYGGTNVRLYKDNNNKVRLLCPKHIDTVQEGYLANAIANGSVFEDAEDIDKNAGVVERLTIPYDAMVNSGREVPTNLKPMIAIVVGRMKDDGSFGVTDADRTNGVNFVKDVTAAKENGEKINGVVDNYVEKEPGGFYTPEIGKGISKLDGELDEVNDTDPADVISDDDTVDSYDGYDMDAIERDPDTADDNEPPAEEPVEEPMDEEGESDGNDNDVDDSDDDMLEDNEEPTEEPIEEPVEECGNNCTPNNKAVVQEEDTNEAEVVDNTEEVTNASEEDMEEAAEGADEAEVAEESYKFDDESDLVAESMMQSLMATFKGRGIKRDVVTESAKEEDEEKEEEKEDEKETVEECGDTKTVEECGDKEVVNEEKDVKEEDESEVVEEEVTPMIPVTPIQEGFLSKKPKKLKPIGRDVVAYITCEMNDIHSSNDQAMLAGYTCSKIELVEWYITVIDTKDPKYIVPHDRQYLVSMKTQLENLLAQILRIRPINRSEQIWRVNYPVQA